MVNGQLTSTICLTFLVSVSVSTCGFWPAAQAEKEGRSASEVREAVSRCRGSRLSDSSSSASSSMWLWLMAACEDGMIPGEVRAAKFNFFSF